MANPEGVFESDRVYLLAWEFIREAAKAAAVTSEVFMTWGLVTGAGDYLNRAQQDSALSVYLGGTIFSVVGVTVATIGDAVYHRTANQMAGSEAVVPPTTTQ